MRFVIPKERTEFTSNCGAKKSSDFDFENSSDSQLHKMKTSRVRSFRKIESEHFVYVSPNSFGNLTRVIGSTLAWRAASAPLEEHRILELEKREAGHNAGIAGVIREARTQRFRVASISRASQCSLKSISLPRCRDRLSDRVSFFVNHVACDSRLQSEGRYRTLL